MSVYEGFRSRFLTKDSVMTAVVVFVVFMVYQGLKTVGVNMDSTSGFFIYLVSAVIALMLILVAMLRYLNNPGATVKKANLDLDNATDMLRLRMDLRSELAQIKETVEGIAKFNFHLGDVNVEELKDTVTKRITEALDKTISKSVDDAFIRRDLKTQANQNLIANFEEVKKGLLDEKELLSRRTNLNLVIGVAVTLLALAGLLYVVFFAPLDLTGAHAEEYPWRITAHYIPRLSFVVFLEIFAYFFLKLYKTGLADIKYYQNEISNIEMKLVALKAAMSLKDDEAIKTVICELSKTERNFVLKPGESTIDLEKFKLDGVDTKVLTEFMAAVTKTK